MDVNFQYNVIWFQLACFTCLWNTIYDSILEQDVLYIYKQSHISHCMGEQFDNDRDVNIYSQLVIE
jgi:hypothetical protein